MAGERQEMSGSDELAEAARAALDVEPGVAAAVKSWLEALRESVTAGEFSGRIRHVGRITSVADGVATLAGLPQARFNELLRFPGKTYGLVFNLDAEEIGCILLGDDTHLAAGDQVLLTGEVARVPVGEALLGRVVDALGRPLDGEGGIDPERRDAIEKAAPAILDRAPVQQQLVTGITAVDALIPIGRGQRELVVGDRASGKTAIAVDTILSQRDSGVICIYVAIGQKVSTVKRVTQSLRENGVMRQTIVVSADADDVPGLQYIAPYSATTMGEYFMEQGRDVLVIYDDLTRHARSYRQLSLLLRRPPGREAYPGDVFFIHSRLLERATRMGEAGGGGSLTAIPIVETQAKNISAYIPTNLISITDGQIFLDPDLFNKGVKPAIHVGKSVSRVGGRTQLPAIRKVAEELRLEYAQFAELEIFTRFGATVEDQTQKKIERGRRIREILKQPRLDPMRAGEQVVILLAVERGCVDSIPVERLAAFKKALRFEIPVQHGELLEKIEKGDELDDSAWTVLAEAVEKVTRDFTEFEKTGRAPEEVRSGKAPGTLGGPEEREQGESPQAAQGEVESEAAKGKAESPATQAQAEAQAAEGEDAEPEPDRQAD